MTTPTWVPPEDEAKWHEAIAAAGEAEDDLGGKGSKRYLSYVTSIYLGSRGRSNSEVREALRTITEGASPQDVVSQLCATQSSSETKP
jgi:hypothetical protein